MTILINIWVLVLNIFSGILPSWNLPDGVYENFYTGTGILFSLNFLFDISLIFLTISLIIGFEIIVLTIRIVSGLLSYLRGGGRIDI